VRLTESSSGFQSLVPLYLVSEYLSKGVKEKSGNIDGGMSSEEIERFKELAFEIYLNDNLTEEQRRAAISAISYKFNKTAFINIVEEPEQNLYPISQQQILNSLLKFNNMSMNNKLIMTTHSPYLINYLTLAVKADNLKEKVNSESLKTKLNDVVPLDSTVNSNDLVIYELEEIEGSISKLKNFEGIPSDKNFLNLLLGKGNQQFDSLLEIEEELWE